MTRKTSQAREAAESLQTLASDERLEQLRRVLDSRVFADSGLLATLLDYLVQQSIVDPDGQIKEYTIALDVFGRDSDFDPRTNSIVRVQVKNLRAKLQAYYETEGRSDDVLIEVPKGHYKAVFSCVQPTEVPLVVEVPAEEEPAAEIVAEAALAPAIPDAIPDDPPAPKTDLTKAILIAATVVLSVAATLLVLKVLDLRSQSQTAAAPPTDPDGGAVWAPFLQSNSQTLLILSNPPVYRFMNNSDAESVAKEAVTLSEEEKRLLAARLKGELVMKQGQAPRLVLSTSSYTGIGEAIGLYHLTDLFRAANKGITLKQSRTVTADDLKNHNAILLGSTWVNSWVEKLPVQEDFVFTVDASIRNGNPMPGEELEYKPRYGETGAVEEDYALITVKPGITEEYRVMTLAGLLSEGTQAAAEFVTKREYLGEMDRRLRQMSDAEGPPRYYQVLLKVGVDNGIPTTVTVLAIHPLKVKRS